MIPDLSNASYDQVQAVIDALELNLGKSQDAYAEVPTTSGATPPKGQDWTDTVLLADDAPYHPTDEESAEAAADFGCGTSFENLAEPSLLSLGEPSTLDSRFGWQGVVDRWPRLRDAVAALDDSHATNREVPNEEGLTPLRIGEENRWYLLDTQQNLMIEGHNPRANHPFSPRVQAGESILWVYDTRQLKSWPGEPIGYIHDGEVYKRTT